MDFGSSGFVGLGAFSAFCTLGLFRAAFSRHAELYAKRQSAVQNLQPSPR
jgi:hypothetical protein